MRKKITLRARIQRFILIIFLVTFSVLVFFFSWIKVEDKKRGYARMMRARIKSAQSLMQAYLLQHEQYIDTILQGARRKKSTQEFLAFLNAKVHLQNRNDVYFVLDPSNRISLIQDGYLEFSGLDFSHLYYVRKQKKVSDVHQSIFTKKAVVTFRYPVRDGYTFYFEKNIEELSPILSYLRQGEATPLGDLFILTRNGVVIYHINEEWVRSRFNLGREIMDSAISDSYGMQLVTLMQRNYLLYREPFSLQNFWDIYFAIPYSELRSDIARAIFENLILVSILMVAVYLVIQYILRRYFTDPIYNIKETLMHFDPDSSVLEFNNPNIATVQELDDISKAFIHIHERMQMSQQELGRSEEIFRTVSEFESSWVYWISPTGNFHYMSENCYELTGYTRDEFWQNSDLLNTMIIREDLQVWHNHEHFVNSKGNIEPIEFRIQTKGGDIRWISHICRRAYGNQNQDLGLRVSNRDVTEKIIARRNLEESEKKFRNLFNNLTDAVMIFNSQGLVLETNNALCRRIGYSRQEILAPLQTRSILGLDAHIQECIGHFFRERDLTFTTQQTTREGEAIPVEIIVKPLEYEGEEVILSVSRDISERRKAQNELVKTQNYLESVINSIPSVIIVLDEHGLITHWNQGAERATRLFLSEVKGKSPLLYFPVFAVYMKNIAEMIQKREKIFYEKISHLQKGNLVYANLMVYPLIGQEVQGAVLIIDDVTEKVRIEQMMIQSEKMMSIGGLAAGMAHEINNPLGIILQGIQNTVRRISPEMEKNQEVAKELGVDLHRMQEYLQQRGILNYLDGIREAGSRAATIVSNMLNFSRKSDASKAPSDLNEILEKTIFLAANDYDLKKRYDFRHIEMIREYDLKISQVPCNSSEIEQVVLNLLKNAAYALYMKQEHGFQPRILVKTRQEGSFAVVMVSDNGTGMDEETKNHIFEPFFSTKEIGVGTGLGLSVSYFIITKHHNGVFLVDSQPGHGTTFTFKIPVAEGAVV